jgi:hypothetical protein
MDGLLQVRQVHEDYDHVDREQASSSRDSPLLCLA